MNHSKTLLLAATMLVSGSSSLFSADASAPARKMGWKPDVGGVVDKSFGPRFRGVAIKESVDLRAEMPPIYDQGSLGSCVGNGTAAVLDYAHVKSNPGAKFITPSRLWLYYFGRVAIGTVNQDSGCQIRDVKDAALNLGAAVENIWPYRESKFKVKPSSAAYADALKHQAITAYKVETVNDVKSALSLGLPVVFGVPVYNAIMNLSWSSYTLPMPAKNERSIGGHCMVVVGYRNKDQMLIVRNSWGYTWGRGGHMLMPVAYWEKFQRQTDAWVISSSE